MLSNVKTKLCCYITDAVTKAFPNTKHNSIDTQITSYLRHSKERQKKKK